MTQTSVVELAPFGIYEAEVAMRTTYNGSAVKSSCLNLQGKKFFLEVLWKMNDDDPYPGEYALGDAQASVTVGKNTLFKEARIAWIASGDVKILRQLTRDEYLTMLNAGQV
jgi:hypothetical protein